MSFESYIRKRTYTDDPQGDFAWDHSWALERSSHFSKHSGVKGTDKVESDTLLGHYNFLPSHAKNKNYVLEALCNLWREWIAYKYIGLRYSEPAFGYVYFLRLKTKPSIWKIGRTSIPPYDYLPSVESREKAKFEICSWMRIKHYDLIEKELHTAFQGNQIVREFFELNIYQIHTAIHLYRLTDENSEVIPGDYVDLYVDDFKEWIQADHPRFACTEIAEMGKIKNCDLKV